MIRKRLRFCLKRYRYIVSVMLITLVLVSYIKYSGDSHKYNKCEKLVFDEFSDKAKKYIYFEKEKQIEIVNATRLRRWIKTQNTFTRIINLDLYGPITSNTLIFVVRVHDFTCNVNYLVASLSEIEGIEDTLLIFSHSYVDHNLNRLIQSIEYCKVLQLFYPYSIQAFPNEFPGFDKNDCPPHLNRKTAEKLNCTNAMTPDVLGRYRVPMHTEKKHHWWWTANKVFADLSYTAEHKGIVVFLDHNFYLYKNFIYIAYEMKRLSEMLPCDFLSFGLTSPLDIKSKSAYVLQFTTWNPKYHSDILAMDLSAWKSIESHYNVFCLTDDYSWSRSLYDVSINRRDGKMFKVISSVAPSALRTACSLKGDVMDCHVVENIIEVIKFQKSHNNVLFSPYFEIEHEIEYYDDFSNIDYVAINGGWNDLRDKQLCSNMTINKEKYYVAMEEPNIE